MDPQPAIPVLAAPAAPPRPEPAVPPPVARQLALVAQVAELSMQIADALGRRVLAAVAAAEAAEAAEAAAAAAPPLPVSAEGAPAGGEAAPAPQPVLTAPAAAANPPPVLSRVEGLPVVAGELTLAFDRAARTVRRAVGLWSHLYREQQALEKGEAVEAREAREAQAQARRTRAERLVERIAQDHFEAVLPDKADDDDAMDAIERLTREAKERLVDDDLYGDLPDRPFSEIIARLCADLGLPADWPRLAGEHWAQAEIGGGPAAVGAPLAAFVDHPPPPPVSPPDPVPWDGSPRDGPPGEIAGLGPPPARWRRRREPDGEGGNLRKCVRVQFV